MEERKLHPISFEPITDKTPWGEECWLLADLLWRDTSAIGGWLGGNSLGDIIETYIDRVVGEAVYDYYGRQFPLYVKKISPFSDSPLLVCPGDELAAERYDSLGKTKLWYILDAEPDATLWIGLRVSLSATQLYDKCLDGSLRSDLKVFKPRRGDTFLVEPGCIHGLGRGVEILEIAESSGLDFTLCGSTQELDVAEAMDFVTLHPAGEHMLSAQNSLMGGFAQKLAECEQLTMGKIRLTETLNISSGEGDSFPIVYYCISGEYCVQPIGYRTPFSLCAKAGTAVLVPAETTSYNLVPSAPDTVLLELMPLARPWQDSYISSGDNVREDE